MEKVNNETKYKVISVVSYLVVCLSIVAKDYYSMSLTVNTFPLIAGVSLSPALVYTMYALLQGFFVEFLSRFVCNSVIRVSFSTVNKNQFISVFKFIVAGVNVLLGFFNFLYFIKPYTFRLHAVIEVVALTVLFSIIYAVIYKKYLNKKSAPVIFLSLAIPLGIYFIMIAIGG